MESNAQIRQFLLEQAARRPLLEIDDLLKALYQAAFGCGHFAPSKVRVLSYLFEEGVLLSGGEEQEMVEMLPGGYARVNLAPYFAAGGGLYSLAMLFMFTADEAPDEARRAWFEGALCVLEALIEEGALPFDAQQALERLARYRGEGCPQLHHSEAYRRAYAPAYRVVRADYAQLLPVFIAIDSRLDAGRRVIAAIDGNSGAGKSTLAALITRIYSDATLVHMDDFFLQAHQRTPERFAQPGGNIDHERFYGEVLAPMRAGEAFDYRPFDCAAFTIGQGTHIVPSPLCVVEGSYSLHPALSAAYDLKIVLHIGEQAQRARILERNGEAMLSRFTGEWIPMENLYFSHTRIDERADIVFDVIPDGDGVQYRVRRSGT